MIQKLINGYNVSVSKDDRKNMLVGSIEGDSNDGDYINASFTIDLLDLSTEKTRILFEALSKVGTSITEVGDRCDCWTDEMEEIYYDLQSFSVYLPQGEYGCFGLNISELLYYDENGTSFFVELP